MQNLSCENELICRKMNKLAETCFDRVKRQRGNGLLNDHPRENGNLLLKQGKNNKKVLFWDFDYWLPYKGSRLIGIQLCTWVLSWYTGSPGSFVAALVNRYTRTEPCTCVLRTVTSFISEALEPRLAHSCRSLSRFL